MKSMLCKYYQPLRLEKPSNFRLVRRRQAFIQLGGGVRSVALIVKPASSTNKNRPQAVSLWETPLSWQGNSFNSSRAASGMCPDHTGR
jgi:hypothetical protein